MQRGLSPLNTPTLLIMPHLTAFIPAFFIIIFSNALSLYAISSPTAIEGTVLSADAHNSRLTLKLKDVKDPLVVATAPGDAAIGYVGQTVTGTLLSQASGPRFENIWPKAPRWVDDTAQQVHVETVSRGKKVFRQVGETFPCFALCNESGTYISRDSLLGQWSVMTFIFTRCQNPYMCPALTNRMIQLQGNLKDQNNTNTQLYLLSFDPTHDTPGILRHYGQTRPITADFKYTHFLTGAPGHIKDLMLQLGIEGAGKEDHTMALLIIDPLGTLVYRKEGSNWTVEEIMAVLKTKWAKAAERTAAATPTL